jgi:hypothetical protein
MDHALQFTALTIYFGVMLAVISSASRIRRLFVVITVFGFLFAFFAILQSVLSPQKYTAFTTLAWPHRSVPL